MPEVKLEGEQYVDISLTEVVIDEHLVTAPALTSHPAWLAQFLKILGAKISIY